MGIDLTVARPLLRVLLLSTGDVCRAPAAVLLLEAALRARLGPAGGYQVASAGTRAPVGCDLHPLTAQALRERGIEPGEHLARELGTEQLAGADLVLATARAERLAAIELDPTVAGRTFTVREFARGVRAVLPVLPVLPAAAGSLPSSTGPGWVAGAAVGRLLGERSRWRPMHPADDDVADPVTGDVPAHRFAVEQLAVAIEDCADLLASWVRAAAPVPSGR